MELLQEDWDALSKLAERVRFPIENVSLLRRRIDDSTAREGSPYTLLVGQHGAGIELLLGRWISPQAAEELQQGGDRPLVIGKRPSETLPRLAAWRAHKWSKFEPGHLIALRLAGQPPADTLAQLTSLGYLDQIVLVTRLGQPLNLKEREMAQSFAPLAATARVLVVGLPGEEDSGAELAELSAYAINQMRQIGFNGGRALGTAVWFSNGAQRPGAVSDVSAFLATEQSEVIAGRDGMLRQAMAGLFAELRRLASLTPAVTQPALPEEELERLIRELSDYLSDLGREVERQMQSRRATGTDVLRAYVSDALRGWGSYTGVEGHWLKYVERLRPGTQAAFMNEAEAALSVLDYEPGSSPVESHASASGSSPGTYLTTIIKRLAIGFIFALGAYLLAFRLLNEPYRDALPSLLITILSYAALLLGGSIGYLTGSFFFRMPEAAAITRETEPAKTDSVYGWQQMERRLLAWFSERMRAGQISPVEECNALAERLKIKEKDS